MRNILAGRTTWGLLLIAVGVLILLNNLSVLPDSAPFLSIICAAFGLYFLIVFFNALESWWAAFPAFSMLGLAAAFYLSEPGGQGDEVAGAAFLGMTGLSFVAIYLRRRQHWWPLIPAGALLSLAGIILASAFETDFNNAVLFTILFGGLAATFFLVAVAPSERPRPGWALWPALVMLVLGLTAAAGVFEIANLIPPVALILLGALLLWRSYARRGQTT